jgi:hypothetical protein
MGLCGGKQFELEGRSGLQEWFQEQFIGGWCYDEVGPVSDHMKIRFQEEEGFKIVWAQTLCRVDVK